MSAHPGSITYVDLDAATEKVVLIAEVPEAMRFGTTAEGATVPVVRVEARVHGSERTIREYGPDGVFLRSTVQRSVL